MSGAHEETAMSRTHRTQPEKLRPRDIKRRRQWEAMQRPAREALLFPEPEAPQWKPLG